MDQGTSLITAKRYADAVRKVMDTRSIVMYGSQARGTATENSDIDIAVIVDKMPEDYLGTLSMLWRLTQEINLDIEPVLLSDEDNQSGFLHTVLSSGIAV